MGDVATFSNTPFDSVAGSYDSQFTDTRAGRWLRRSVWSRVERFAQPGMRVLDLGCGTGEDAVWLARRGCFVTAADNSPAMLRIAMDKARHRGLESRIVAARLDLNQTESSPEFTAAFDLVLSNFGAANCVEDLEQFAKALGRWVKPEGIAALTVMSRFCAWEIAWYAMRLDSRAMRRWTGNTAAMVGERPIRVRYWSIACLRQSLSPSFRLRAVYGIGTLLPPSYLFPLVDRWPRLFGALSSLDRSISPFWPLSRMADHMLVVFQRTRDAAQEQE